MALQPKGVKIGLADPDGGGALQLLHHRRDRNAEGGSITEGIGQGRITANLEGFTPDMAYQVPDDEALPIVFDLLQHEGLCWAARPAINIAGAMRMAREMGPGHTIVTILCDYGTRYQSKLFNPAFLREKGLPVPGWLEADRLICRRCLRTHDPLAIFLIGAIVFWPLVGLAQEIGPQQPTATAETPLPPDDVAPLLAEDGGIETAPRPTISRGSALPNGQRIWHKRPDASTLCAQSVTRRTCDMARSISVAHGRKRSAAFHD